MEERWHQQTLIKFIYHFISGQNAAYRSFAGATNEQKKIDLASKLKEHFILLNKYRRKLNMNFSTQKLKSL